ncbi:hypothetical protein ACGFT2_23525 [Streptomyces sp. NPDC048514]|uniref:hypothetical protein n=1 Tax=Streptomyces sp. NPDC048514 TaxID=3365564 RepID=UPI00371D7DDF
MSTGRRIRAAVTTAAMAVAALGAGSVSAHAEDPSGTCTGDWQQVGVYHNALWNYNVNLYVYDWQFGDESSWYQLQSVALPFYNSDHFGTSRNVNLLPSPSTWLDIKCKPGRHWRAVNKGW